jgi:hypothetical protein
MTHICLKHRGAALAQESPNVPAHAEIKEEPCKSLILFRAAEGRVDFPLLWQGYDHLSSLPNPYNSTLYLPRFIGDSPEILSRYLREPWESRRLKGVGTEGL